MQSKLVSHQVSLTFRYSRGPLAMVGILCLSETSKCKFGADLKLILDEHRREIATWLAAPDPFPNHNAARKKRQPSTGMWLLDSKAFTRWIRDDNRYDYFIPFCNNSSNIRLSFLWLYGIRKLLLNSNVLLTPAKIIF